MTKKPRRKTEDDESPEFADKLKQPWVKRGLFGLGAAGFGLGCWVAFRSDQANALLGVSVVLLIVAYLGERLENFTFKHGDTEMTAQVAKEQAKVVREVAETTETAIEDALTFISREELLKTADPDARPNATRSFWESLGLKDYQTKFESNLVALQNAVDNMDAAVVASGADPEITEATAGLSYGRPTSDGLVPVTLRVMFRWTGRIPKFVQLTVNPLDHTAEPYTYIHHAPKPLERFEYRVERTVELPSGLYRANWTLKLSKGHEGIRIASRMFQTSPELGDLLHEE